MADPITPGSSPPATASDPPSAPTPLDENAAQFMAAITASAKLIPGFQPEHPETARFVRRYRGFSKEAITMAINAVEENPELEGASTFNLYFQALNPSGFAGGSVYLDNIRLVYM